MEQRYRLRPVIGLHHFHAVHRQHFRGDFHVQLIVLRQQDPAAMQVRDLLLGLLLALLLIYALYRGHRQRHRKPAALAQHALHRDLSAHLLHQALDNRHTQTGTYGGTVGKVSLPGIGIKNMLQKVL